MKRCHFHHLARARLALALLLPALLVAAGGDSPSYKFPITGYVHVQWKCVFAEDWSPSQGFLLRRARLKYEHSFFDDARTEVEVGFDNLALELKDAFFEYRVAAPLRITAGLHKMPFSREELVSVRRMTMVERTRTNDAFGDVGYLGRDIGVTVDGDLFEDRFPVGYAAGVYNGNRGRLSRDDNNAKQFAERLTADPFGWLSVGLNANQRNDSLTGRFVTAWGGDIAVRSGEAAVTAEALYGNATPGTGMLGVHVAASYRFGAVEPAVRLEWLDPDRTRADDEETELAAGLNWYLHRLIQIKANWVTEIPANGTPIHGVTLHAQAGF